MQITQQHRDTAQIVYDAAKEMVGDYRWYRMAESERIDLIHQAMRLRSAGLLAG